MTKLSAILANHEANPFPKGVIVDTENFTPPEGVETIAFLLQMRDGDIEETLIDVIIAWCLAEVDVILEIPADIGGLDAKYLLSVAANVGFSLSLLPSETEEGRAAYHERLAEFTRTYLAQANYAGRLYPVTSHLEYMIRETLVGGSDYRARDPYVVERFAERVPETVSDAFKAAIREAVFEATGGEEGFRNFAGSIVLGIYRQAEENARDLAARAGEESGF